MAVVKSARLDCETQGESWRIAALPSIIRTFEANSERSLSVGPMDPWIFT